MRRVHSGGHAAEAIKGALEIAAVLGDEAGAAVEDEEDEGVGYQHHGGPIHCFALAHGFVEGGADYGADELGHCVDEAIGVIDFIAKFAVKDLIFYAYLQVYLQSF